MTDLQQGRAGTWYIIWRNSDGVAVSETDDVPAVIAGLSNTLLDHRPDPAIEQWDPATHTVIARIAPTQTWQAPPASSSYKFTNYVLVDNPAAIQFTFYGPIPPSNKPDYITVTCTDAELSAAGTQAAVVTLVTNKLQRKLRASGIVAKLDVLIGQSVVI